MDIYPHDKFTFLFALIDFYEIVFGENFDSHKWFELHNKYLKFYSNMKHTERDKIEEESIKKLIDYFFNEIEKLDPDLTIDSYK